MRRLRRSITIALRAVASLREVRREVGHVLRTPVQPETLELPGEAVSDLHPLQDNRHQGALLRHERGLPGNVVLPASLERAAWQPRAG